MKAYYLLTVETNLTQKVYERNFKIFENFESAKSSMRSVIKDFATSENDLFDGNGNIIGFEEDFDSAIEEAEELYSDEADAVIEILRKTPEMLKTYFLGDDIYFDDDFYECYHSNEFEISENCSGWEKIYSIEGEGSIPFKIYDFPVYPFMQINAFEMDDPEKTYVIRIRSACEEWEQPSFLYLELRKIDME